jgi:hypothetical protein
VLGCGCPQVRTEGEHRHAGHHDPHPDRRLRGLERAALPARRQPGRYGITDGPAYRDLEDPGTALFHLSVEDMDTAMGWFRSDTFKEATRLAKVTGRRFYLAQPQA